MLTHQVSTHCSYGTVHRMCVCMCVRVCMCVCVCVRVPALQVQIQSLQELT